MDLGREVPTNEIDLILEAMQPEHCALLIYTVSSYPLVLVL